MVIEYDRARADVDGKILSLMESIQLALNEIETDKRMLAAKVDELQRKVAELEAR